MSTTTIMNDKAKQNKKDNDQREEGIQVVIRMRPLNATEQSHRRVWKVNPKYSSIVQTTTDGKPLADRVINRNCFTFDKTFGEDATTRHVYDDCARSIVKSVCSGLNGTIFAYGQTSSGKTFTMQGSGTIQQGSAAAAGIIHMAAREIFQHITSNQDRIYLVRASFLEIYNEDVRDLLSSDNSKALQIREDPRRGVFVICREEVVTEYDTLLGVLAEGEKSRAFAATAMNERSSRSHTIFRVTIESRQKQTGEDEEENESAVIESTLNLVDLAGSESVRHTGVTGERQKEGGMINTSLLTLSRVMNALGANTPHVNYRDSKLTRILQPSLSGNARMAVICCATSSELYLEETRSTLLFAFRAKLVKTRAQVNEIRDDRSQIRRLQKELADARWQLENSSGTVNVRELEQLVASSSQEASNYKEKCNRLMSQILNGNSVFVGEKNVHLQQKLLQKRRLSDGVIYLGESNNQDLIVRAPQTLPRPCKRFHIEPATSPPPASMVEMYQEALHSKSQEFESKLESAHLRNEQLQAKLSELNQEASGLSTERDSLREKERYLLSQIGDRRALEDSIERLQRENASVEAELASLKVSHEGLQSRYIELDVEKVQLLGQVDQLNAQHQAFIHEHDRLKENHQQATHRFGLEKTELGQQLQIISESKYTLEQTLRSLEAQVTSNYEALQARNEEVEFENARIKSNLEHETSRLESERLRLMEQVERLTRSKATMKNSLEQLEAQMACVTRSNNELQTTRNDLDQQHVRLSSKLGEVISQNGAMDEENTRLRAALDESVAEKAQQGQALDSLAQSKHAVEQELESVKLKLDEVISRNGALDAENARLKAALNDEMARSVAEKVQQGHALDSLADDFRKQDRCYRKTILVLQDELAESKLENERLCSRARSLQSDIHFLLMQKKMMQNKK